MEAYFSEDINQILICWELTKIVLCKNEILISPSISFNMDISVNLCQYSIYTFQILTCILEIRIQESVSKNIDIGPSFYFMKCRNLWWRIKQKLPVL